MNKGKWYFTYIAFDNMENQSSNARVTEKVELKALIEEEAALEATTAWNEIKDATYEGWDKKKYPHSPRVIYEIELFIRFREHRGDLEDSMKTQVMLSDRKELIEYCKSLLSPFNKTFEPEELQIKPYSGADIRIGWQSTYIVTLEGHGVLGFTDKMC